MLLFINNIYQFKRILPIKNLDSNFWFSVIFTRSEKLLEYKFLEDKNKSMKEKQMKMYKKGNCDNIFKIWCDRVNDMIDEMKKEHWVEWTKWSMLELFESRNSFSLKIILTLQWETLCHHVLPALSMYPANRYFNKFSFWRENTW